MVNFRPQAFIKPKKNILYLCWFDKGLWPKIYHKYIRIFCISVEEKDKIDHN